MPEATQESMARTLRASAKIVSGRPIADWTGLAAAVRKKFKNHPTAVSALECALLDAYCRAQELPLHRFFGSKSSPIRTTFTVSALDDGAARRILQKKSREGFHKFKIKVTGADPEADFNRIKSAAAFCGREKLIVDANQGWRPEGAARFIDILHAARLPVALIEQPVRRQDIKGMAFVRKRSPYPIAADESLRSLADAKKIIDADAADVLNIKIAKLGLLESFKVARVARAAGKKLMIGCMMESTVGLATSVFWAIGSGIFHYIDLDSFLLLKPTRMRSSFGNVGDKIYVRGEFNGSGTEAA